MSNRLSFASSSFTHLLVPSPSLSLSLPLRLLPLAGFSAGSLMMTPVLIRTACVKGPFARWQGRAGHIQSAARPERQREEQLPGTQTRRTCLPVAEERRRCRRPPAPVPLRGPGDTYQCFFHLRPSTRIHPSASIGSAIDLRDNALGFHRCFPRLLSPLRPSRSSPLPNTRVHRSNPPL